VALISTPTDAEACIQGTPPPTIPREVSRLIKYLNETVVALEDEAGQTMAEYAVVLGVITIAVVVTLGLLSTAIKNTLNNVIASL
jgi:Flp pilus assembly pilin Flp